MAADVWKIFQAMQLISDFKSGSFYQVPPSLSDLVVSFQSFVRSAECISRGDQLTTIDRFRMYQHWNQTSHIELPQGGVPRFSV